MFITVLFRMRQFSSSPFYSIEHLVLLACSTARKFMKTKRAKRMFPPNLSYIQNPTPSSPDCVLYSLLIYSISLFTILAVFSTTRPCGETHGSLLISIYLLGSREPNVKDSGLFWYLVLAPLELGHLGGPKIDLIPDWSRKVEANTMANISLWFNMIL